MKKNEEKKQTALHIFLTNKQLTIQEIADMVGVSEKTIRLWRQAEKWEELRAAKEGTRTELIHNLEKALISLSKTEQEVLQNIKEITRLTLLIEKLSLELHPTIYIQAFKEFNEFLKKQGKVGFAKELNHYQNLFVKEKLK